jgi:hypothetical protein
LKRAFTLNQTLPLKISKQKPLFESEMKFSGVKYQKFIIFNIYQLFLLPFFEKNISPFPNFKIFFSGANYFSLKNFKTFWLCYATVQNKFYLKN